MAPSTNGDNGRNADGHFTKGNPGGPGNPFARRTAQLRSAMIRAVSEQDVAVIIQKLVAEAKEGDVSAAREVLTRVLGRPTESVDPDRVDLDEQRLRNDRVVSALVDAITSVGPCVRC